MYFWIFFAYINVTNTYALHYLSFQIEALLTLNVFRILDQLGNFTEIFVHIRTYTNTQYLK